MDVTHRASDLPSSLAITCTAGALGAPAITVDSTNGSATSSNAGASTYVRATGSPPYTYYATAWVGTNGGGGSTSGGGSGSSYNPTFAGSSAGAGGIGGTTAFASSGVTTFIPYSTGGGGGGAITAANALGQGAGGGANIPLNLNDPNTYTNGEGTAGQSTTGVDSTWGLFSQGGWGGNSGNTMNAGNGGSPVGMGAGGGGGGASLNGFNSGAGGQGGPGGAIIITYFN